MAGKTADNASLLQALLLALYSRKAGYEWWSDQEGNR